MSLIKKLLVEGAALWHRPPPTAGKSLKVKAYTISSDPLQACQVGIANIRIPDGRQAEGSRLVWRVNGIFCRFTQTRTLGHSAQGFTVWGFKLPGPGRYPVEKNGTQLCPIMQSGVKGLSCTPTSMWYCAKYSCIPMWYCAMYTQVILCHVYPCDIVPCIVYPCDIVPYSSDIVPCKPMWYYAMYTYVKLCQM